VSALRATQGGSGGPRRPYTPPVPSKTKVSGSGRYDEKEIAARVDKLRKARGVEVKVICAAIGLEKWDWSRKVRLDRSSFSIEELSRIADYLSAPPGWPFLPAELGEVLERVLRRGE
jgi:hypothetical protein